ncbi:hypothetical protein CXB51_011042 [Gossypium anomalum]|uniref:DUF4283 domain-containing protein n=1 Tax=Gossypium anomalum TaxID=47600 RepID=A0A8J6D2M4_9ROSI|nr:hypothetical protein CXB51_011042 [Gossypium anomalum]
MAGANTVDEDLANLNIMDDEEDPLMVLGGDDEENYLYELCLVGRVLTDSVVHFSTLKNTLTDLWHPLRGVSIMEMEDKRILFRFYSEIDLQRVLDGVLWFFNRHLIIFHRLVKSEEPNMVPLWETMFWVQIHNLPIGFTTKGMARQIGDFIGDFLEYDTSLVTRGVSQYMRIRVIIDTRLPLKRKKKIGIGLNKFTYALFQYERLLLFCFLCCRLGHGESFCQVCLTLRNQQMEFGWDLSLRAAPRRGGQVASKWLWKENETDKWVRMEIDGERRERVFKVDVTNNGNHSEGMRTVGRSTRQPCAAKEEGRIDSSKQVIVQWEGEGWRWKIHRWDLLMNVRGLGQPRTVRRLKNKLRQVMPQVLFLMETKVTSKRIGAIRRKCRFGHGIDVDAVGTRGGLSLGWREGLNLTLKSFSKSRIDMEVEEESGRDIWRFTGFYGSPVE